MGEFYQRNKLVKGKVKLRGHEVDLSNVRCSVLNVSGKWDYAVPPCQTKATSALACGPDQESITLEAGHVGMLVGPGDMGGLWSRVRDWFVPRSGKQGE